MSVTDTSILFNSMRRGMQPQDLVNLASALLVIHEAGYVDHVQGGPEINAERCREVLDHLEGLGFEPEAKEVDLKVLQIVEEIGVVRA